MNRTPHPPYLSYLAPCDFYLFGYIKRFLAGCEFADPSDLLQEVMNILNDIDTAIFEEVFLTWMRRLIKCININDEYVE
jgi:hypothetical protein